MGHKRRVVFLRSTIPFTTAEYYFRALKQLDVDLVDVPFNPHEPRKDLDVPEGDLILLVDCGVPVEIPALDGCRSPKGYVSIDSCHKAAIHKAYCAKYRFDYIWVAQKHMVAELGPNARWIPLAADPEVHVYRPEARTEEGFLKRLLKPRVCDIGMCGAPYKHRRRFEKLFRKAGLKTNFYYRKKFGAEAVSEYGRCTIGFNVGAGFTGEKGKDINMRVFETMANGHAMLLTNVYDGLGYEELFEEGRHYVTFRTEQEAVEKAVYYSRHPSEALRIAREGQRHILSGHTYLHRCKELLSVIGYADD
ncbi:MAG: glycosyltransferase [Deltaproteobacteria bacterium]|nr:glycosyltransferase [Deltaproteobacteria bacterium]